MRENVTHASRKAQKAARNCWSASPGFLRERVQTMARHHEGERPALPYIPDWVMHYNEEDWLPLVEPMPEDWDGWYPWPGIRAITLHREARSGWLAANRPDLKLKDIWYMARAPKAR